MPDLLTTLLTFDTGLVRSVQHQGRDYLVAPVVMVIEGVLNSAYISGQAIRQTQWNGIPVTLGHPMVRQQPVSANSPMIRQDYQVGEVFNVRYDQQGIRGSQRVTRAVAEAWIDVAQAAALGPDGTELLRRIQAGERMENSVGFFPGQVDRHGGIFQGARFEYAVEHLQADHLAILLDEIGACSNSDGCGFPRINKGEIMDDTPANRSLVKRIVTNVLAAFSTAACDCNTDPCACESPTVEQTMNDTQQALYGAFAREQGVEVSDVIIEDIDGNAVIYRRGEHTRRRTFRTAEGGVVQLNDDETTVQRETRYLPVTASASDPAPESTHRETSMAVPEKVNAVLAHPHTPWGEVQRGVLETMSEEQLDAILVTCNAQAPTTLESAEVQGATLDDALSTMSQPDRDLVQRATARYRNDVALLIHTLTERDIGLAKPTLESFSLDELEKLERATRPGDYSLSHLAYTDEVSVLGQDADEWLPAS